MRAFAVSTLIGTLLLGACGSGDDPAGGGAGGSSGGSSAGGRGGRGGTGGSGGSGGAGGSGGVTAGAAGATAGSGGSGGAADGGPVDTAATSPGDAPAAGLGWLGPGSADDSPPLVLPGSKLIFDGKTLTGWMPCDPRFWSVKDGTINGDGSGNNFCLTADDHDTFRITGK